MPGARGGGGGGGSSTVYVPEGRAKGAGVTYLSSPGLRFVGNSGTQTQSNNRAAYELMRVRSPITIDQLTVEVTTAQATGKLRAAIYKATNDFQPTDLVVESGDIDASTTGVKNVSIAATALEPGLYLKWLNANVASIVTRVFQCTTDALGLQANLQQIGLFYTTQAYGAPPNPGLVWDTIAGGTPNTSIFIRESVA